MRHYRKVFSVTLFGWLIYWAIFATVYWAIKELILVPLLLPFDGDVSGPNFRGGILDCRSIRWLEERYSFTLTDEVYFKAKKANGIEESKMAEYLSCNGCFQLPAASYLNSRQKVCDPAQGKGITLMLMIKTAPGNFERRQAVRQVLLANRLIASRVAQVRHLFVVGAVNPGDGDSVAQQQRARYDDLLKRCVGSSSEKCRNPVDLHKIFELRRPLFERATHDLRHEAFTYSLFVAETLTFDDLLIVDSFNDSYNNLIYKSAAALQWTAEHCSKARFVALMDDDTFLFVDRLLRLLKDYEKTPLLVAGNRMYGEPVRFPLSKWYMPRSRYPLDFYPDFFNGPIFLLGNDTVPVLLKAIANLQVTALGSKFDDLIITGFARALAGINETHICNFSIGTHPWSVRRAHHIAPWTVAFLSTARNTKHVERTFMRHLNSQ